MRSGEEMDAADPETCLRVSVSLALGPCLVPDSRVWRRPTLFMADETGDAKVFS